MAFSTLSENRDIIKILLSWSMSQMSIAQVKETVNCFLKDMAWKRENGPCLLENMYLSSCMVKLSKMKS